MAAGTAATRRQPRWHRTGWLALAVLFVALIALRLTGMEDQLRDALRAVLRTEGQYADRRFVQGIIVAAVLVAVSVGGLWWFYRASRSLRGKRNTAVVIALASGAGLVLLVTLRLISLHAIDLALYGPLKLNWFGDLGGSTLILAAAVFYIARARASR